jgi:quinol monooxygenase YgiN
MITRIVKLEICDEHIGDFRKLFTENKDHIESFPGCQQVILVHGTNAPNTHFTISRWQSEQDLENYRHSELFGKIWPTVKPWFMAPAQAWSTVEFGVYSL